MADQQIYTRGVRRSAAPTVRLVLPTTRSAATANDLLQNLIIDRSAPQQPRPMQQMQRPQQVARPPQFAQRNVPQRSPNNLRLEGQGVLDQIRNLLITQRGLSPDAADAELVNEQGGQAGRDAAGSMMGRTDNDNNAIGRYGPGIARTLGNLALSGTLGPLGPTLAGVVTRNLTNDDPNAVAADAVTTGLRTSVTNAVPGLGLARMLMGLFRLPDPVVKVEETVKPIVKDVIAQLTNPPALPAAGEGAINPDNPYGGPFGPDSNNSDDSNANSPWGGAIIGADPAADRADADAEGSNYGGNYGGRDTGGGQGGSAGSTGGSGRGIGGSGFGGGNGGSTGGLGGV